MKIYEEARVKLINTEINKLKSAAKNKTGTTLTMTKKNFQHELPHEVFKKYKIRNAFANNMSTYLK